MNRDLVVWGSLDLQPFMFTEKPGLQYFFEKNFPSMVLPSRGTLSRGALYDIYDSVIGKVKIELSAIRGGAICIMMDGWTDKYKRYPYIGLRVAYVDTDWQYKVTTISLKILEKHTDENMSAHVREELKGMGVQLQSMLVFTTTDGAANMVKASQLLRATHFQHCVAHSLHLLLVTDGISRIPELDDLLKRCKTAVIKLDAKCYVVDNENTKIKDREMMDEMLHKIATVKEVLEADHTVLFNVQESESAESQSENDDDGEQDVDPRMHCDRHHKTLKLCGVTRWNSILTMVDSILCLWTQMNEALKFIGDREHCLNEDDRIVLCELKKFLQPFAELTDLVSSEQPHLAVIPLIIREVKDASKHVVGESDCIRKLKDAVELRLPYRIKMSVAVQIATLLDPSTKHLIAADLTMDEMKKLLIANTKLAVERMETVRNREPISCELGPSPSGSNVTSSNRETRDSNLPESAAAKDVGLSFPLQCSESSQPSKKMKLLQKFRSLDGAGDMAFKIEGEVNTYLHLLTVEEGEHPLLFWKKQEKNFPHLSLLAKNYLTISASSVPVEAMFSTCGLMLNVKRSSMAPYRANILSVIHDNYPKFFPITRASADAKL
jgi:hypothetical protein